MIDLGVPEIILAFLGGFPIINYEPTGLTVKNDISDQLALKVRTQIA